MGHHIQHSQSWHYAYRSLAAVSLAASLLIGSAAPALAESMPPYDGIGSIPLPPLDTSAPYEHGSPHGEYILPGTRTRSGQKKVMTSYTRLPPLPREDIRPPLSLSSNSELPSPRRVANPAPASGVNLPQRNPALLPPLSYDAPPYVPRAAIKTYYPKPQIQHPVELKPMQPLAEPRIAAPQPMSQIQPQLQPQPMEPIQSAPVIVPSQATPTVVPVAPVIAPAPMAEPEAPFPWTHEPIVTPQAVTSPIEMSVESSIRVVSPADIPTPAIPVAEQPPIAEIAPLPEAAVIALDEPAVTSVEPLELQEPIPALSQESRDILAKTPSGIDSKTVMRTPEPVIIRRVDPNAGLMPDGGVRTHEEIGLKIEVRKADVNIHHYLEQGYENLLSGRMAIAAGFYEQALEAEPKNEMALFGLATTYQRMNHFEEARELYGKLLGINPTHREALNNFMVLVSKESPQAAIEELEKLETENPDFSPIPAQLGIIYKKLGNNEMASQKLARALALSPDNISYKYNLAITLDSMGRHTQAADLYIELVEDYNDGANLPGDPVAIKNRAIYLRSKK